MTIEIKVPVLPESVSDATVATWHKKPGDSCERDEKLVDIETDKVVLEVSAPEAGVLDKILKNTGATVLANEVIGSFTPGKAGQQAESKPETKPEAKPEAKSEPKPETKSETKSQSPAPDSDASPAARRRMAETGKSENINSPNTKSSSVSPVNTASPKGGRLEQRVPMTRLRKRIAERLLQAQQNAAILTTFNEINMQPVMDLRAKYKEQFEKTHGVKLGFMSFFTKAVVEALRHFPVVNASIDGDDVVYHGYFDIGVAVSSPRGLVVPIIRDADSLSMAEIEKNILDLSSKAKEGKLSIEELTGGTFTISNGGVFGSLLSTPILNPPQSGILGMHKIEPRPVVENNEIVIRPMMYVAMSYDHRLIDGSESVKFLCTVKDMLEDPARFVLEV